MAARRGPGPGPALLLVLAVLGPGRPLRGVRAALNLQELSELKYGLEILAEPVLAGQVGPRRGRAPTPRPLPGTPCWGGGQKHRPSVPPVTGGDDDTMGRGSYLCGGTDRGVLAGFAGTGPGLGAPGRGPTGDGGTGPDWYLGREHRTGDEDGAEDGGAGPGAVLGTGALARDWGHRGGGTCLGLYRGRGVSLVLGRGGGDGDSGRKGAVTGPGPYPQLSAPGGRGVSLGLPGILLGALGLDWGTGVGREPYLFHLPLASTEQLPAAVGCGWLDLGRPRGAGNHPPPTHPPTPSTSLVLSGASASASVSGNAAGRHSSRGRVLSLGDNGWGLDLGSLDLAVGWVGLGKLGGGGGGACPQAAAAACRLPPSRAR